MQRPDFNPDWNHHYDYGNSDNIAEITRVESYNIANDDKVYVVGSMITSPWGDNRVTAVSFARGQEVCTKEITVRPGGMLSLQRHRNRDEIWHVKTGILSLIIANHRIDLKAGDTMSLPCGTVHCMANLHDDPVSVLETQRGINRESDNIRLMDVHGRPIYPLMNEEEYYAAQLYARLAKDIGAR